MALSPDLATQVDRLNSIEQVMARLNVGRSQVFGLFRPDESGEAPLRSVKIGRRRLVPEQSLRDYIASLLED